MADGDHTQSNLTAAEHRLENPIEHLGNADIRAVTRCLEETGYSLLAMRRLAIDAHRGQSILWRFCSLNDRDAAFLCRSSGNGARRL